MAVDLSASIYTQYLRAYKAALKAEQSGHNQEAAGAYRQAADFMRDYAGYALDPKVRQKRLQKSASLTEAAKVLKGTPQGKQARTHAAASQPQRSADDAPPQEQLGETEELDAQIKQLITRSTVAWQDVAGLDDTKAAIQTAYFSALAQKPPKVEISGGRGILLYGPPGTGKTLLAAATAGSLDATFFNAKASDMLSKWFGESTQKVSALFRVARQMHPSVIFLDEIEALSLSRESTSNSANLQVVSTMLAELDGLGFKDEDQFVLSIGATNVPWLLDTGILRRFPKRIYVPLPDLPLRQAILELHITAKGHATTVPITDLAERTEGFSGDEIRQLCSTAVEQMIRRVNPDSLEIVKRGRDAVRDYTIKVEPITADEFAFAFSQIHPITDQGLIRRFDEWSKNTHA